MRANNNMWSEPAWEDGASGRLLLLRQATNAYKTSMSKLALNPSEMACGAAIHEPASYRSGEIVYVLVRLRSKTWMPATSDDKRGHDAASKPRIWRTGIVAKASPPARCAL